LSASFLCTVGDERERAGSFEARVDAVPGFGCCGDRVQVLVQTAAGTQEAGCGPVVFCGGRHRGGESFGGVRGAADDREFGAGGAGERSVRLPE
jgi:hypothetical protein